MTEIEIEEMKKELILLRSQRERMEEQFQKMQEIITELYADLENSVPTPDRTGDCAKDILETVLTNSESGGVRGSPVVYLPETQKWAFWNESATEMSNQYDTIDDVLAEFNEYCDWLDITDYTGDTGEINESSN